MIFKFNRYFNQKFFSLIFLIVSLIWFRKKDFKVYGKDHGKYFLPKLKNRKFDKWIISAGVGDNISFDIEMLNLGYKIIFIDPTPLAIEYFKNNFDHEFYKKKSIFYKKGLWKTKTSLKFFYSDKNVISNTISNYNQSNKSIDIETITIGDIMLENKIDSVFLIKLDIEGAELEIVDYIFQKKIKPHYLLIEFDFLKQQNLFRVIISLFNLLKKLKKLNFKIIYIDNLNFTFKREV